MWRLASPADDEAVVAMCRALNEEDPGPKPVPAEHVQRTIARLREEPARGRIVVLDRGRGLEGYAILISFWSNELGGEICNFDEIYVVPEERSRGWATALVRTVERGELWPSRPVAFELEVTPDNVRARSLYERLGFAPNKNPMMRKLPP
ncbi:MAG: GNAT family N-acetyltransferase [Deltaproteobacteria bacterium]|nr:GNAT family N-acetyltransferase [Deltaproteobacteria bacterium]